MSNDGGNVTVQKQRREHKDEDSELTLKIEKVVLDTPKFPNYAQFAKRRDSYNSRNWPSDVPVTPDSLAKAGLVYLGEGDTVQCFVCGGELSKWEEGDDPVEEHAKLYTKCPIKGKNYEEELLDETEGSDSLGSNVSSGSSSSGSSDSSIGTLTSENAAMLGEFMCQRCKEMPTVIAVCQCGCRVACSRCAPNYKKCPGCKKDIEKLLKGRLRTKNDT